MNPLLPALALSGPWRPLPPLEPGGEALVVSARMTVTPVEYCAGDIAYRIEGTAVFHRQTTSATLTVPLPPATSIGLSASAAETPRQVRTFPGDL